MRDGHTVKYINQCHQSVTVNQPVQISLKYLAKLLKMRNLTVLSFISEIKGKSRNPSFVLESGYKKIRESENERKSLMRIRI